MPERDPTMVEVYGFKTNVRPIRAHPYPTLFPGTDICADCGESYRQPGLVERCRKRHNDTREGIITA